MHDKQRYQKIVAGGEGSLALACGGGSARPGCEAVGGVAGLRRVLSSSAWLGQESPSAGPSGLESAACGSSGEVAAGRTSGGHHRSIDYLHLHNQFGCN